MAVSLETIEEDDRWVVVIHDNKNRTFYPDEIYYVRQEAVKVALAVTKPYQEGRVCRYAFSEQKKRHERQLEEEAIIRNSEEGQTRALAEKLVAQEPGVFGWIGCTLTGVLVSRISTAADPTEATVGFPRARRALILWLEEE